MRNIDDGQPTPYVDPLEDFARRLEEATGARPRRSGNALAAYCPVHEADGREHTPSLAIFRGRIGRVVCHCRAGCSQKDVAEALRRLGIALPAPSSDANHQHISEDAPQHRAWSAAEARRLWQAGTMLDQSSVVADYLAQRHLILAPGEAASFREVSNGARITLLVAALVAPATFRDGHVRWTGVQTLAVGADGRPILDSHGRKIRRVYGSLANSGVLLGVPRERVVVGEGIESTLSAMRILECDSGIAALGANNLPWLSLPSNVRHVEIAADHDIPGRRAARLLKHRLRRLRLTVRIAFPTFPDDDFNDVLRKRVALDQQRPQGERAR